MNETELTERLDARGILNDALGPGCYALELRVPEDLHGEWFDRYDASPEGFIDAVEASEKFVYAGAAQNIYERLCEHVNGEKRRASVLRVCPPVEVVDVEPHDSPFEWESRYARGLAGPKTVVYSDGELF